MLLSNLLHHNHRTRKTARVFDGLSLKIPSGQTAALIGSSGSGKVSQLRLAVRLFLIRSHGHVSHFLFSYTCTVNRHVTPGEILRPSCCRC